MAAPLAMIALGIPAQSRWPLLIRGSSGNGENGIAASVANALQPCLTEVSAYDSRGIFPSNNDTVIDALLFYGFLEFT